MKTIIVTFIGKHDTELFKGTVIQHGFKSAHTAAAELHKQAGGKMSDVVEMRARIVGVVPDE